MESGHTQASRLTRDGLASRVVWRSPHHYCQRGQMKAGQRSFQIDIRTVRPSSRSVGMNEKRVRETTQLCARLGFTETNLVDILNL